MGSCFSMFCFVACPQCVFRRKNLVYEGKNSSIYVLPMKKKVCKVVSNHRMYESEKEFVSFMKHTRSRHPHIIQYDWTMPRNHTVLFMESADTNLLEWVSMRYTSLSYRTELINFFRQMASGYSFLLDHRIEHYDIKPNNLFIVRNVLKIADFGASQIAMDHYVMYTGTRGYMAPEIVNVANPLYYVPHSMDVYSICIMIAYILYGTGKSIYKRRQTCAHYLEVEKYFHESLPSSFLAGGLVMDQRLRMPMEKLIERLQGDQEM